MILNISLSESRIILITLMAQIITSTIPWNPLIREIPAFVGRRIWF